QIADCEHVEPPGVIAVGVYDAMLAYRVAPRGILDFMKRQTAKRVRYSDVHNSNVPSYRRTEPGKEIRVPASVRIAKEKIAAKLQLKRERTEARARAKAAREERAITKAALKIAKRLDQLAAQKEREAAKLERKAERLAFQLARRDRVEE